MRGTLISATPRSSGRSAPSAMAISTAAAALMAGGCLNSLRQGWLDPTALGNFEHTATLDIRTSLTLEDAPHGVPGAEYPQPQDHRLYLEEYPISPGDTLSVEIYELRERLVPYQANVQVSATGYVNLPVIGRVHAAGDSVLEFEDGLADALREQDVLLNPQITITPLFLQDATYSIFGIGVSAAVNAPLRAGTFPIRRPDLRILEAINQVGGLNEFVTEVYVFRDYVPPDERPEPDAPDENARDAHTPPPQNGNGTENSTSDTPAQPQSDAASDPRDEVLRAVLLQERDHQPPSAQDDEPDVPELLEPAPSDPFIWVDGEYVPNPAYKPRPDDEAGTRPSLPFDTPVPAVNWARIAGDTTHRIVVIPAELLRTGDVDANIYVRPGDVIRIVSGEIGVYYVMGQVNRVGAFAFNAEPITLKAAIAAAGGLAPLAWPDRCTVYRRMGQREQMIQVDLDRIFAGKDEDFFIRRGDLINVGTHPVAPFLQSLRGLTIPNPVSNVGYSFTYARNFADIDSFAVQQNPANVPDRFPSLFP